MTLLSPGRCTRPGPHAVRRLRGLAVAAGVALALSLSACGGSEEAGAAVDHEIADAVADVRNGTGDDEVRRALSDIDAAMAAAEEAGPVGVGDCATSIMNGMTLDDVVAVDCAAPHGAEVYLSVPLDGLGSTFPGEDAVEEHARPLCETALAAFLGGPPTGSGTRSNVLEPSEQDWQAGDTSALCYAFPGRPGTVTGTLAGSAG